MAQNGDEWSAGAKAEQRSAEIEQLKTNENYRKEFLQNLSHEIKTPIFAIQGYVDTLLDGALDNPETAIRFLKNASKNVDRMVNLVKDLDEIAKLEMGEQPLDKTSFFKFSSSFSYYVLAISLSELAKLGIGYSFAAGDLCDLNIYDNITSK